MIFRRLPKPGAFERIRISMLSRWFTEASDRATVVAFTSWSSREGVTTVVAGLARSFGAAEPGTVLVIDAAPSRQRIASRLKVQNRQVSFANIEASSLEPTSAPAPGIRLVRDDRNGVDILTLSDPGPSRSGSASKARLIVEQLCPRYRVILLDAGALSKGWAHHWLACASYRVLVIDVSKATREVLEYQRKQFENGGIKLHGSILNKRVYPIPKALYWLAR